MTFTSPIGDTYETPYVGDIFQSRSTVHCHTMRVTGFTDYGFWVDMEEVRYLKQHDPLTIAYRDMVCYPQYNPTTRTVRRAGETYTISNGAN